MSAPKQAGPRRNMENATGNTPKGGKSDSCRISCHRRLIPSRAQADNANHEEGRSAAYPTVDSRQKLMAEQLDCSS